MNRKLLYITLSIFLTWLPSCIMENAYCPDFVGGEDNPFTVSFVLSTRDAMTRAESDTTWGDEYKKTLGNDFENQIKNLALIIYNSENAKVTTITDFNYFAMAGAADDRCAESYIITAEITDQIGVAGGEYRFVVVANAGLSETDAENTTYELSQIENDGIPMWGAVTKTVSANSNVDLGTIHLLRAVAKVEIKLSDEVNAKFDIERAVVTKYNEEGYVFPNTKTTPTLDLNHAGATFNVPNSDVTDNLVFVVAEDKKTCHVYITEWEAIIAENAKIALQFKNDNKPYEIEFKNYEGGKPVGDPHNIVRNHHYQYTITKVNTGVNLELTCQVQPWTLVEEEWDYTDVPAVYTGGYITWSSSSSVNNGRVNLTSSNATFTFGLSAPENATWRAEFVTIKGNQNAFKFTEVVGGNNQISYATGDVGNLVTLTIGTKGTATVGNNEAYLRIWVILPDGRTIRVSDMLYSANEKKEYVIVQTPII